MCFRDINFKFGSCFDPPTQGGLSKNVFGAHGMDAKTRCTTAKIDKNARVLDLGPKNVK